MVHDQVRPVARFNPPSPPTGDLVERIEGQIERRAAGQIRDLHVLCQDDTIIIRGRSRTYHAKQLAQQAVLDFMEEFGLLANQIVVC